MKLLLALVLSLCTFSANAGIVTYSFAGVFDAPSRFSHGGSNDEPLMLDLIQAGDRFSGRFTFDTTSAPDGYGLGPWAIYPLLGFEMHVSERFDSVASAWQLHSISVTDDKERGYGELVVNAGLRLDPAHTLGVVLRIEASESTAFDGFRVPDGYDDFYGAGLFMSLYHYDHPMIDQVAASTQVALDRAPSAIPEPATGLLLLAGLAGLASQRRR